MYLNVKSRVRGTMSHMPKTIWSHDALPLVPPMYRPIYTVLLPIIDALLIAFGVGAAIVGSGVVQSFTIEFLPVIWAFVMLAGAVTASVGLVFMLDQVEVLGKYAIIVALVFYALLLAWDAFTRNPSTILSVFVVLMVIAGLTLRVVNQLVRIGERAAVHDRTGR